MARERDEKHKLESQLRQLQSQFQSNTAVAQAIQESEMKKMQEYRELRQQFIQQREREKALIEEKMRKEEEVMLVETNYQNLQEEVDDMRKLIKNFRVRYKQAVTEINDLNEEHANERAELFDQIQVYDKELSLYKTLLRCVIEPRDI
jgi:kinesin family protein 3/17